MTWLARGLALGTALTLAVSLGACRPPTSFEGEAQFQGGPRACFDKCNQGGMDMASFVYVGEFSSACACKPRVVAGSAPTSESTDDEAATVASAAGVELQRRRIEEAQRNSAQQQQFGKPY